MLLLIMPWTATGKKKLGHLPLFAFNQDLYRILSHSYFVMNHLGINFIIDIKFYLS